MYNLQLCSCLSLLLYYIVNHLTMACVPFDKVCGEQTWFSIRYAALQRRTSKINALIHRSDEAGFWTSV